MTERVVVRYENGVFVPLAPINLPEQEYVIEIEVLPATPGGDILAAWQHIYDGLEEEEITEIEKIMLDRDHFMGQEE